MKPLDETRCEKTLTRKKNILNTAIKSGNIREILTLNHDLSNFIFDLYTAGCYDWKEYKEVIKNYCLSPKKEKSIIKKGETLYGMQ